MRIGYDAKRMLNNPTGLGNHARILLNAVMRDYPDNDYLLFSPKATDEFFHQLHGDFHIHFPESRLGQSIHPLWRSYDITRDLLKNRVDLYHGLSNELPFNIHRSGIASVVTIHDLIFLKHKEQYPWIDRQSYSLKTKYAAKYGDAIIAVSQETKEDLIELYKVPEKKISVIYQSIDQRFYVRATPETRTAIATKYKLPQKYILHVGSFFPRKNQLKLIEAFDRIKNDMEENLVLVGSTGGMLTDIQNLITQKNLSNRVHIVTEVSNDELPAIYQMATVFVFPALFEGFGMPVLEALVSGVPVIATRGGAIEEAAGSGSLLVDPHQAEDIAAMILKVTQDRALQKQMREAGYKHAETMTDKAFAAHTMALYTNL
jgi:glycosyltransferase involved in cell wall biosynthesis